MLLKVYHQVFPIKSNIGDLLLISIEFKHPLPTDFIGTSHSL